MATHLYKTIESECLSHWVVIEVRDRHGGDTLEFYKWDNLRFDLRLKYDWYFKYRAALAQVKNPKLYVEFRWGSEPAQGKTLEQLLQNKLRAKKGQVTKFQNILSKAVKEWNSLFPIEDDPIYQKCLQKLNRLKNEYECIANTCQSNIPQP